MNLYDLINEELKRMTEERNFWLKVALESPDEVDRHGHRTPSGNQKVAIDKYKEIGTEILKVREKIFNQFEEHDKKIQEIIAEKALTGNSNE